jgi:outer membrane protein TolC
MYRNKITYFKISMAILIIFCTATVVGAEEISLKEAISQGLNNNLEIKQQNNINNLERQLQTIRAQQGWQIKVSSNYSEVITEGEILNAAGVLQSTNNLRTVSGSGSTLSINRNFASGLNITQEAVYNDENESDYGVLISYPLFKGAPTESEKSYYQQEQEFLKAKNDLNSLIESKITAWLGDYLQILRLKSRKENADLQLKNAQKTYAESQELYKNSQLSQRELKSAEAAVIDAETNYKQLANQYQNSLMSFKLALNLDKEIEIALNNKEYLNKISSELINYQDNNFENMYKNLLKTDYDLKSAVINLRLQEKQLKWFRGEGRTDINLSGSYNYSTDRSTVGVTFSYDLFDGSQREFNEKNLKDNIQLAQANLANLKESKKLVLENQLSSLNASLNKKKSSILKLENAENQFELAGEQYDSGLITKKELKQQEISYQQSKISYQEALDQLFIVKLELTMLINNDYLDIFNRGVFNEKK